MADAWSTDNIQFTKVEDNQENIFSNNFCEPDTKENTSEKSVLSDNYSSKLEERLTKIQQKKVTKTSGKDMLNSLKTQRESFMTNLMTNTSTSYTTTSGTIENQSFFENLYQTNSFYRHINPQQALESSEKIPIVHHDQLTIQQNANDFSTCADVKTKEIKMGNKNNYES